ncbi:MAG: ABC transporter substrate-binding protein [Bacillota bacterium]|nr:ABC transporter substrate-binding protein [Bacillota bacterium]
MKQKLFVAVLALCLLLTACGGGVQPTAANQPTESQAASNATEAPTSATTAPTTVPTTEAKPATLYTKETLPDFEAKANAVVVTDESVTFVDGTGKEKTIAKNPQRVVGLYPSHIILWYEEGGSMVGRITTKTSEKKMPEAAKGIEIVGETVTPDKLSLEKIMSVQPDLVILGIGGQMSMVDKFAELGVESIVIDNEHLDDYLKWVKVIANLNGKPELYEQAKKEVLAPIQELLLKVPAENNPKALMIQVNEKGTLVVYLPGTTAAGIMADLGAVNVAIGMTDKEHKKVEGVDKAELSFESILTNQPELILLKHSDMAKGLKARQVVSDTLGSNPVWMEYEAVKADEIYDLPPKYFHYKPTKEYFQAYEYMAKILYPEIFGVQEKEFE